MNNLPEELQLHILTYIKVLSVEIKPLLEINKSIRKILWENKYNLNRYPCCSLNESIACVSKSYIEYMRFLREQRIEMEEESIMNDTDEEIEEVEHYSYLNFAPF